MRIGNSFFVVTLLTLFLLGNCKSIDKEDFPTKPPKSSKSENVEIEAIDIGTSDPEADRTVYYKIFLNKELAMKTSSGLFFQRKTASLNLEPGRYLFFAERWYLDENPENEVPEYKRANNVWQMKQVYLDVPEPPLSIKVIFGIDHDKSEFYMEVKTAE